MTPDKGPYSIPAFSIHFLKLTLWDLMSIPTAQTDRCHHFQTQIQPCRCRSCISEPQSPAHHAVTGFIKSAYTAAETKFGASIPQAEMVNMKKWHMWWPLPDKLLLGLDVAGVANYFHLLCCKISILLPPGQGSNDHLTFFSDLVVLYWRYTVTIKLANWKILSISQ